MTKEQEMLAQEIATTLDDLSSLSLHKRFVMRYSKEYLLTKLQKVMSTPDNEIIVSRGAYYNDCVRNNR